MGEYYALCNSDAAEQNGTRIALLNLGENAAPLGQVIGMTVYTSESGDQGAWLEALNRYASFSLTVESVSLEELLAAHRIGKPTTVFLDGEKLAGSVFLGMIKAELGLPITYP